jgi:hypothetical protein
MKYALSPQKSLIGFISKYSSKCIIPKIENERINAKTMLAICSGFSSFEGVRRINL